jgi:hypothetical protein
MARVRERSVRVPCSVLVTPHFRLMGRDEDRVLPEFG